MDLVAWVFACDVLPEGGDLVPHGLVGLQSLRLDALFKPCYSNLMSRLVFLKLGGSLITDKTRPYTARSETLARLGSEIASALRRDAGLQLVLGHGSGSFGHTAAKEHRTRDGLPGTDPQSYWRGFAEVWYQAAQLNRLVMDALHAAGVATLAFSPAASVTARDGQILTWDLSALKSALQAGLTPVVYGDVIFDTQRGGTILSTEDLFIHLARHLQPDHILLAGLEAGVWADFPARTRLLSEIRPEVLEMNRSGLGGAVGADVTGGMLAKVEQMLTLVQEFPRLKVYLFSGDSPGAVEGALCGTPSGTVICSSAKK